MSGWRRAQHGANRTGRPFTGDFAGELLYATLLKFGLAEGEYRADPHDGLRLTGTIILNAVKCLPPENKPIPEEIRTCRTYLEAGLATLPNVRVVIALGQIAHIAAARALGLPPSGTKFGHGAENVGAGRPCAAVELSLLEVQSEYRPPRSGDVREGFRKGSRVSSDEWLPRDIRTSFSGRLPDLTPTR